MLEFRHYFDVLLFLTLTFLKIQNHSSSIIIIIISFLLYFTFAFSVHSRADPFLALLRKVKMVHLELDTKTKTVLAMFG